MPEAPPMPPDPPKPEADDSEVAAPVDPDSAMDVLSTTPSEPADDDESVEPGSTSISGDILSALDAPSETTEGDSGDVELSVDDFKWNENVLLKLLDKNDIDQRDAFLLHAIHYDADQNQYLKKSEIQDAIDAWLIENPPEVDPEQEPKPEAKIGEEAVSDSAEDSSEATVDDNSMSEKDEPAPEPPAPAVVDLPPPPLPPPPAPVEEPELPPAPEPPAESNLPPAPSPPAPSVVVIEEEEVVEVEEAEFERTDSYSELWKRRSGKSLPQMYGAIDRISSGEVGTLLDRYSDRFGHELDREIIVMRKAEHVARRDAVPTVELISVPSDDDDDDDEEETFDNELDSESEAELREDLSEVEDLLRPLQRFYKAASNKSEKKLVAPALKGLIAERKALLAVLSGEEDFDILDNLPDRPEIPDLPSQGEEDGDDVDRFNDFFAMINGLLGEMPEEWVGDFVDSKSFKLFQKVGEDPSGSDTKTRKRFFKMINNELGEMPEDMLDEFLNSDDFKFFQQMGEIYGE